MRLASDKEIQKILKEQCGRTEEQIDAIIEYGQLSDALVNNKSERLKKILEELEAKYEKE